MEEIVNKVISSGLVTVDLSEYLPEETDLVIFDLKPYLFQGMILKEKDFREALKTHDWKSYEGKIVGLTCTADAIIPMWAYMLVTIYLPSARDIFFGDRDEVIRQWILKEISALEVADFQELRVVIKGCGDRPIPPDAYIALMKKLQPIARSVMFGEPCSTVPVYKRRG